MDGYGLEPYPPVANSRLLCQLSYPGKRQARYQPGGDARSALAGYNGGMTKFRIGVALGLGAGYYLGAKAGRDRYVQINRLLRRLQGSDAFSTAVGKARAVVDLGKERARSHEHEDDPVVDLSAASYSYN